ncbi:MAG: ABC transporter ATP-binding protein [Synechococcaceae cyanobacterium SM2_3_1]|nr:ABC transporter ATP-binding protein [Synechococcaceae cyanobacterium SM2_3_1]
MSRKKKKIRRSLFEAFSAAWRLLRIFWPQISQQRSLLWIALAMLLLEVVARVLEPWPMKFIFDNILINSNADPQSSLHLLTMLVLVLVGLVGLRAGAAYLSRVSMAIAATQIMIEVRSQLYGHLQKLSLAFHHRSKNGDLITRVTSDIERLREVTVIAVLPLLVNTCTLLGMMGVMLWINWQLSLIALAIVPAFALTTIRSTNQIQGVARQQRQREGAMAATAAESISAIKVVQALSLQKMLQKAFAKQNAKSLQEGAKAQKLAADLERTVESLVAVATALVIWRGVVLVLDQQITPGDLIVFINYLKTAFKPMRQLAKYTSQISKAVASGERVTDLLAEVPEVRDQQDAIPAPHLRGKVQFEAVSFAYSLHQEGLRDINLTVCPGEKVALVGPSGGGKSTLTNLLLRFYDPQDGRILIDGQDIRHYQLDSLRQQISIVLQDSVLFAVSVRDNIAYGCLGATPAEVEAAARLANAHDFIKALPQGYDTILGEGGATLSGGQRQRIAIARAAIRRAPIIILDEPTAALDKVSAQVVNEALDRLIQGRTALLISHDLRAVETADQIVYIEAGVIQEQGTHAQLIKHNGRYALQYRTQVGAPEAHCGRSYALGV